MSVRVAAVDCGTNSLRLLVADMDVNRVDDRVRRMEIVRLGENVDRTGRLADGAIARTIGVLREYAETIRAEEAERIRMVATSAIRDASNSAGFVDQVRDVLGVTPDVITGDEEAALSFAGATRELAGGGERFLVVDIGGGSTEFVLGDVRVSAALSVDVGCVRLTERHFQEDPPTDAQIAAARADVDAALTKVAERVDVSSATRLVGVAGTVTTLTGIALDLPRYDAARIHHAELTAEQIHDVAHRLLTADHAERAAIPVMHPGRVDVIAAGALVLDTLVQRFGFPRMLASEHDILDGIAWSLV